MICTRREISGSWNSGPEKLCERYLFFTSPNELKLHGNYFAIYIKYWSKE
jgi:hypothetical protein